MPILSKGQCDSAISLCPKTFDYLIKQDVLAKKYYQESINLLILNGSLKSELSIKDSLVLDKEKVIDYLALQSTLYDTHLQRIEKSLSAEKRKVKVWKGLSLLTAIAGSVATGYFIIH